MDYKIEEANEKANILVVDDDEIILRLAKQTLISRYNVNCARNGEDAVDSVKMILPDLILTDINMPGMNGFQMITRIREMSGYRIPFIIMTGNEQSECEIKGFSFGADDYLRKPFSYDVMLERVDHVLKSERNQKRLELEACSDGLTGAWNRKYITMRIREDCIEKTCGGAFIILDLDNFKKINDTYGHKCGDDVLRGFVSILRSFTRKDDVAARLGGDEFAVFYSGMVSEELVSRRCEEIIAMTENELGHMVCDDIKIVISVSIGVSFAPRDGNEFSKLYEKADDALYSAKKSGKGNYRICSDDSRLDDDKWDMFGDTCRAMKHDSTMLDIRYLNSLMKEDEISGGAYVVNRDEFRKIYRFLKRGMERDNRQAQIALLSLKDVNPGNALKNEKTLAGEIATASGRAPTDEKTTVSERASKALDSAVRFSLRRGDVAARIDNRQYAVILIDTDADNGKIAADRVRRNWIREYGEKGFAVEYDVEDIRGAV